jgi:hypothetical protein
MSKKTAAPDVEVTAKDEPVDLAEGTDKGPFDDLEPDTAPETATDDLDLDTPVPGDGEGEGEPEPPIFTPVHAMEQFEQAMAAYPNSCLKHMLAEWKSQEREARKFEERQRVRGDIP